VIARLAVAVLLLGATALVGFLPFAGRYLVVRQPLERSDAIVVLAGSRVERWLEAVDLYRGGWAPRIALSRGRTENAEHLLHQMGIPYPADADLARDAMVQLKVPADAIVMLPDDLDNTAQEAAATRRLATASGWGRIIVVTSKYHSRRTAYAFAREFRGTPIRVSVHPSAYDPSVPSRWWSTRADFRFVTSELQKLVAYHLGLRE
jgi:uncharacterized SAM-binding protein YcdF (DUF218 family)